MYDGEENKQKYQRVIQSQEELEKLKQNEINQAKTPLIIGLCLAIVLIVVFVTTGMYASLNCIEYLLVLIIIAGSVIYYQYNTQLINEKYDKLINSEQNKQNNIDKYDKTKIINSKGVK